MVNLIFNIWGFFKAKLNDAHLIITVILPKLVISGNLGVSNNADFWKISAQVRHFLKADISKREVGRGRW